MTPAWLRTAKGGVELAMKLQPCARCNAIGEAIGNELNDTVLWVPTSSGRGLKRAFMAEFRAIVVTGNLVVEFASSETDASRQPLICGVEVRRNNAKEITERVALR